MPVPTIDWDGGVDGVCRMIDQTLLPLEYRIIDVTSLDRMHDCIRRLVVRGAPAIGIAAAYGVILGLRERRPFTRDDFWAKLTEVTDYLATARPTAVNLFWALSRMNNFAHTHTGTEPDKLLELLLAEARHIHDQDREICRRIGSYGKKFIKKDTGVLTHCNAGGLATADYGTALAVMFAAHEQGKRFSVYADETRPLLQGARLTTWELMQAGIDVTLICDNMANQVMKEGKIQCVIVGADRIAANGDAANKIGTSGVAVLAKEYGIPFYVAAPTSTFDLTLETGDEIPIEQRAPEEVASLYGTPTAPEGVKVYNPAFDVTPAAHITGIVTERGVIEQPTTESVRAMVE